MAEGSNGGVGERTPEEWGEEFRSRYALYERFTEKLAILVEELLERTGIDHTPVESRTKSVVGFIDKLDRKAENYPDPLADMPDLVGLRVIVYYVEDRARVAELIDNEFEIDWSRSEGELENKDPDRFGYSSAHYVVKLKSVRAGLTDWQDYREIHAEVQVRTVLQHAWAAISHKLDYKSEIEVPRELRRQLFRLSALLELADEQFEGLRQDTEALEATYGERVGEGDLQVPLDAASLELYLLTTEAHRQWAKAALDVGWRETVEPLEEREPDRTELLTLLLSADITTLEELEGFLNEQEPRRNELLTQIREYCERHDFTPWADPRDILQFVVLGAGVVGDDVLDETMFRDAVKAGLRDLLHEAI